MKPILAALIGLYAVARVLQVFPGRIPILAVVALHVICPLIFALIHGAKVYGWRGIGVFVGVSLVIGNLFENLGVLTGFPFGRYYFTDVMGPKIFFVPVLLGLAYVGMGYLSWTLACVIEGPNPLKGSRVLLLPLIATFLMVSWDLSQEPIWATIVKAWIWVEGGPYFGVPLSNFAGWFLVAYVQYQLFALYLKGRSFGSLPASLPLAWLRLPVLFYAVSASGNLLLMLMPRMLPVVSDPAGKLWQVRDIIGTCGLVSIFTMGAFAVIAWARLNNSKGHT
jgi:putative membrane protein